VLEHEPERPVTTGNDDVHRLVAVFRGERLDLRPNLVRRGETRKVEMLAVHLPSVWQCMRKDTLDSGCDLDIGGKRGVVLVDHEKPTVEWLGILR
jgi:hypothetical protein